MESARGYGNYASGMWWGRVCPLPSYLAKINQSAKLRSRVGRLARSHFVLKSGKPGNNFWNQMTSSSQNVRTCWSILQGLDKSGPEEISKQPTILPKHSGALRESIYSLPDLTMIFSRISLKLTHWLICNMTYFDNYVTLTCGQILTLTFRGQIIYHKNRIYERNTMVPLPIIYLYQFKSYSWKNISP